MKKFSLLIAVMLLSTTFFAAGFYYENPITLRAETSFGLFEGDWDLVMFNPAHLSLLEGSEFYTKYDQNESYDLFELAFRHQLSKEMGTLALYFSKEVYSYGDYDEFEEVAYNDVDGDGISDEKEVDFETAYYFEKFDEYKFILNYGKAFSKEFQFGAGIAFYTYRYFDVYEEEDFYTETQLDTNSEQYHYDEYEYGEQENKRSEFDFIAGSIYELNKDITLEGAISFNSIKNGRTLTDVIYYWDRYYPDNDEDYYEETESGEELDDGFYGSPYSGIGLNFDLRMHYKKWKDHQFTLDLSYKMAGADVSDGEYVESDYGIYNDPDSSTGMTYDVYEEEWVYTTNRTGTGVKYGHLAIKLRYFRPFGKKVNFSTGIYYTPFYKTTTDYDSEYQYEYSYDNLYGDSIYDDHYYETYSYTRDVQEIAEGSMLSFPLAVEIKGSKTLTWRFGIEHMIASIRETYQWELLDYTTLQWHSWTDNDAESYGEDQPGGYDTADKESYTETDQFTDFRVGLCYNPVANLFFELTGDMSIIEFDELYDANMGLSVRYLF